MNIIRKFCHNYFSKTALPYWAVLTVDSILIMVSALLAVYLANGGSYIVRYFWHYIAILFCGLLPMWIFMKIFHTYSGLLRYSNFSDLVKVGFAVIGGHGLSNIIWQILRVNDLVEDIISLKMVFFSTIISITMLCGLRVVVKYLFGIVNVGRNAHRVLIFGVRQGGISLAKSIRNEHPTRYVIKGFVSTEKDMIGRYLLDTKVYAADDSLIDVIKRLRIEKIYISPLYADDFRNNVDLVRKITKASVQIMMMHNEETWDGKSDLSHNQLHEVDIEDLLPRDKIEVDMEAIGKMLCGKRILITGAAGSIGSEMVRQVAAFKPSELILVDQAETPMHDIRLLMARNYPDIEALTIVGSISNETHMEELFSKHRPEYVFHAAAYKHVPMMEDNPAMAVQNNIYGTRVIADLAVKYGTKKFVMISTDKAVNPTNVMGCSKRICEIYCQSLNKAIVDGKVEGVTQFVTTRFGNVLGSNGSVIPLFRKQLAAGGPLTVTHPDIIRFFMLIPEACQLVLEAGTMGEGGEIFVFDMGKPVRIADLAQRMIDLSGAKNVEIKFTGLRDGEKLYEEVLSDAEQNKPTHHPKIMVAQVREYPYEDALRNEKELYDLSFTYNDMDIVKKMKEIVPEYKSQHSKYQILDK